MRPNLHTKRVFKLLVLSVAILLTAGKLFAQQHAYLAAQKTVKQMPDGQSVPMWGYALCQLPPGGSATDGTTWSCGAASVPGPTLEVVGNTQLRIHVYNTLPTPVSVMVPGQTGGGLGNPTNAGDRMQSMVPEVSTGTVHNYVFNNLKPGTYLYESGTMPSIEVPMGLYGALVVKPAANQAYADPGTTFDAEQLLIFSEVDAIQNAAVDAAANIAGYPKTVNFNPKYFLINGTAFDRSSPAASTFSAGTPPDSANQWTVLLRLVNAGSLSHTALPVGLQMMLLAEDGNVYPDRKTQADVLLGGGKAIDVMFAAPKDANGKFDATYPVFDRMLGLSSGDQTPDSGMLAYLTIGNGSAPVPIGSGPRAVNDAFLAPKNSSLTCSSPAPAACNILTNDSGITSAQLVAAPQNGTVELHADGTYIYTPNEHYAGDDSFSYSSTNGDSNIAVVVIKVDFTNEAPVARADTYSNNLAGGLKIAKPGVLGNDTDYDGDALTAELVGTPPGSLTLNADGSFNYTGSVSTSFQYRALDSHGNYSDPVTVDLNINAGSGLSLTVKDPAGSVITEYRWLVEEDRTLHHEGFAPNGPSLGTTFHASYMPVVAQGCVGAACAEQVPISEVVLDPSKYYYVSVLPNDAGNGGGDPDSNTPAGHTIGGSPIKPGQNAVSVLVNPQAIKTAQISVLIFEDNAPTNGIQDGDEGGLANFQITLVEAGGRYGQNGGQMSQDTFGNPLRNALPCAPSQPAGVILTCPDGTALIQNLAPGKYTILADPPGKSTSKWVQTSTIEGTRGIDAWVKSGEPSYFQEFGPPGYHVFIGFVSPDRLPAVSGNNTVQGKVTNLHMSRTPDQTLHDSGSRDALAFTTCWVALNSGGGVSQAVKVAKCDEEGNFKMTGLPNGSYELVVWDEYLDQIIASRAVTLPGGNLGNVPVFSWFTRLENYIFIDTNENGIWDADERPLPNAPITMRFRDGSWYQGSTMDNSGYYSFDEAFPFFNWMTIEADPGNRKSTGLNVTVDGGGPVDAEGVLNPQIQADGQPQRVQLGPVRVQATQGFIGQTSVLNWGMTAFKPGENGGISGMISYASTRSEDDVRMAAVNTWEPGVPDVTLRLYRKVKTETGGSGLVFVAETKSTSWDRNLPTECPGQPSDDPFLTQSLLAVGQPQDACYDGMHNWNQVRPGVYDGRYSFTNIKPGTYVVEVVVPPGYELVKEEDKNVFTGDAYIAPVGVVTPVFGVVDVMPSQSFVLAANAPTPGIAYPACVGEERMVPQYLSLFPSSEAPFGGSVRALCDRKEVKLDDQAQALADFHLFTSVPIAAHFTGMILDDLSQEFNPASPNFGEKWAPAFVPVSIRDFNGVEIGRVYSDQWGMFNGLLPSTYSANVPLPSGYSPAMLTTCMNDPGPIAGPNGSRIIDPQYNPMYSNFCYTMQYMPGTTTYLDTPVLPTAAFASGYNPVDCAYPQGTPSIRRVDGDGIGPFIKPAGPRSITIYSEGMKPVPNPQYDGPGGPNTQKTIMRDFGFGSVMGTVRIGGANLAVTNWSNDVITATVPANVNTGELEVVRGDNGKATVASVTVTIEDINPIRVSSGQSIQAAIDSAAPGSLVLVGPGQYEELVVMWKPIRLQGAGAGSTVINAAKFPAEKLDAWRTKVQGLVDSQIVDLLPGQNGVDGVPLIGPGLLGDEEGAGVTVLGKADPNNGNPGPNSYRFLPSSIDGFSITGGDSGGGIFVNGYAHGLQIANNNVYGNAGFFHGGIRVGHPNLEALTGTGPFDFNSKVSIHHNSITTNGSVSNGAAGGGISLCTGTDNYHVNYNFICGNFSNGHGGGIGHYGLSDGGEIANNQILFNQSFDQGTNQSGGGIFIGGEQPLGGGLTLGAGNVTIDSNLIQGNQAGAGHGGGIRLQEYNGQDVQRRPSAVNQWWQATITNNLIVNNVAGWAGAGISLQDTANSTISNNTIVHNDSTSTVGATFTAGANTSVKQPAGISSELHSTALAGVFGNGNNTLSYRVFSNPTLTNNIVWQNRSFNYDAPGGDAALFPKLNGTNGACDAAAYYWDLGLLGDQSPTPGANRLNPRYSILTAIGAYGAANAHNSDSNPNLRSAYCNGPRTTRSIAEVTNLLPLPALDEGGNWIDVRWGPLTPTGDYHLADTSPAIDAGTTAVVYHDFDMQPRPLGAGVDIGADEVAIAGAAPKISASSTSVNFGTVRVASALNPAGQTLTIQNTGTAPLQISGITVGPTPFERPTLFGGSCTNSTSLSPGQTCTIRVAFGPATSGSYSGSLVISSNDPATPSLSIPLTGTSYQIDTNTTAVNLTYATLTTRTANITVRNWGAAAVAMGTPQITGTDAASFSILSNNCGSSLAAAISRGILPRTCTIQVRFTTNLNPTPAGGLNAVLNINSADAAAPQTVTLHGTRP